MAAQKTVQVFMAEGFEEMELVIVVDVLRRGGCSVRTISLLDEVAPVTGSRGVAMVPDGSLRELQAEDCDLLVVPGGMEGTKRLAADDRVLAKVRHQSESGRLLAAVCAGPMVLVKAGVVRGRPVTSHPGVADQLHDVSYREDRVVVDRNLITSRGPGTTFEFAFALLKLLKGTDIAENVNAGVLARLG